MIMSVCVEVNTFDIYIYMCMQFAYINILCVYSLCVIAHVLSLSLYI